MVSNQMIRLADYQPHPRNYNCHPADQVQRIARSLTEFGQVRSVVVWRNYFLAGHGVREAALSLGWDTLRADILPDDYDEQKALAYVVADNELSRFADPDHAQLASILDELNQNQPALMEAAGYTDIELQQLLAKIADPFGADDPAAEWVGMPEFEHEDLTAHQSIHVHFKNQADVDAFAELVGQKLTDKTRSIWYPKAEIIPYGAVYES